MCSVKSDLTREKLDDDKNKSQQSDCSVMEIRCTFFLFLFASLSQSLSTSHRQFYSKPSTIKQRRFQLLCGKILNPEAIDWKRHFSWAFIALSAVMKLVYCDFIAGYFGGGRVWCKNLEKFPANISKSYFFYSRSECFLCYWKLSYSFWLFLRYFEIWLFQSFFVMLQELSEQECK